MNNSVSNRLKSSIYSLAKRRLFARRQLRFQLLVILTVVGVLSLGTDVGVMYYQWMQMRKSADSSALAGATDFLTQNTTRTLPNPTINAACTYPTVPQNVACSYALNNFAQQADMTQGGIYVPAQTVPPSVPPGAQTIQVTLRRNNIPVFFLQVLGRFNSYGATVTAIAVEPTAVSSIHNGLFPAAMPPNPNNGPLTYGTTFSLTDDYGPGNWGWLDLPNSTVGGGANQLATNISSGCTCDVKIGDSLNTKPGATWGPVQTAVNGLITQGNLPANIIGNESQLVTVAIVNWGGANGASNVTVLGFAELWIDSISKTKNTETLTVQFVRYIADTATKGGGTTSYGAYFPPYIVQ
jgi:hypothetical protein